LISTDAALGAEVRGVDLRALDDERRGLIPARKASHRRI
jgi:hypothetical protein